MAIKDWDNQSNQDGVNQERKLAYNLSIIISIVRHDMYTEKI